MARQIHDLVIDEVSLVKKGANQHAMVTIAKSADSEEGSNMGDEIYDEQGNLLSEDDLNTGDVVYDAEGNAYEVEDDEDFEDEGVEKSAFAGSASRMAGSVRGGASRVGNGARKFGGRARSGTQRAGMRTGQRVVSGLDRGQRAANSAASHVSSHRTAYGVSAAGVGAGAGAYEFNRRRNSVSKSLSEEISKALGEAVTDAERDEIISKAMGQVDELSEIAKSAMEAAEFERQMRLEAEYTEIAKSYAVPVEPTVLGGVLMRAADALSAEDCEVIEKCLEAASSASELFEEMGAAGTMGGSDTYDKLHESVAKSARTRDEALEVEEQLLLDNPELYEQYLAEQSATRF